MLQYCVEFVASVNRLAFDKLSSKRSKVFSSTWLFVEAPVNAAAEWKTAFAAVLPVLCHQC